MSALIELYSGPAKLVLHVDGKFHLHRGERLCASGQATLSPGVETKHAVEKTQNRAQVSWDETTQLTILPLPPDDPVARLLWPGLQEMTAGFVLEHRVRKDAGAAELCLDMESAGSWFGGPHLMRQHWPLNRACMEVSPYYPFDNGPTGLNNLVGSHWVTSHGVLCMVDPDTPFLHVGINAPREGAGGGIYRAWGVGGDNATREILPLAQDERRVGDGLLRLQSRADFQTPNVGHPLRDWVPASGAAVDRDHLTIRLLLVAATDARDAAMQALAALPHPSPLPPPSSSPSEEAALPPSLTALLGRPIWSTWARFYSAVSQAMVEAYASQIVARGFPRAVMEIDDRWQVKYGDFDFDPEKFPDPKTMVGALHAQGFLVTVWVMPFAEETSEAYKEGGPKGYFMSNNDGRDPDSGLFRWWQPSRVAALDVTNPVAVEWFVSRLERFQQRYGVDGFKFDAGEPCFLPGSFRSFAPLQAPAEYTRTYIQNVVARFPLREVRTGHRTTHVSTLTRIGDRFSTWTIANGLASVLPTVLTSGLLGYPFVLPDMVGGNGYFDTKPDAELMVRWAQASALMPAVQFSIAPWDVGEDAARLCLDMLKVREFFQPLLSRLADDGFRTSRPLCRPMWWLDPCDAATWPIADQFALGDDVIVAPVVTPGVITRDVYIPRGLWRPFQLDISLPCQPDVSGPCWLKDVPAPLSKLPIYIRVQQQE